MKLKLHKNATKHISEYKCSEYKWYAVGVLISHLFLTLVFLHNFHLGVTIGLSISVFSFFIIMVAFLCNKKEEK